MFTYLFTISNGYGQDKPVYSISSPKAIKLYEKASGLMKERQFDKALVMLEKAVKTEPKFVEAYLNLAACYKIFGKDSLAKKSYFEAAALKPESKELVGAYMALGNYYFKEGNYIDAKRYFEKVLKYPPRKKSILTKAEELFKTCEFAVEFMENPVEFKPELMSENVNKHTMQISPVLTADQQLLIYYVRESFGKDYDENIVVSKKNGNQWTAPISISNNINTAYHEGHCTISADGRILVFASCNREDGFGSCDLYISKREGYQWSMPVNLGKKVNSEKWDSEPSVSADGRTIYFSSDRSGTYGKEDIWVTTYVARDLSRSTDLDKDGEWSVPQNLGTSVNTSKREVTPFIHADGQTLFLASTGYPGMGGFDLFYTNLTGSGWTSPKNLGYPLNTQDNESSLFITADWRKGYFSKYEQKGYKSTSKLYEFDVADQLKSKYKSTYAKGAIYDAVTKKKLVYQELPASIELYDLKTGKLLYFTTADRITGEFLVVLTEGAQYAMYVNKDSYLFKSLFFDYLPADPDFVGTGASAQAGMDLKSFDPLILDIYLEPIKKGSTIILHNVFFDTGKHDLREKSKTELEKMIRFMNANKNITVEIAGHTDNVGSYQDNIDLSLKRAQSVHDYLLKGGIDSSRLKYKGYGETKPIAPNDSDLNRQINRRIEFRVL